MRAARLDAIAEELRHLDADIVVLNEVDFDASWSHRVNQAEYLATQAGYPFRVEQRNLDFRFLFWTWRFGNAILSRHPISSAQEIKLPDYLALETWLAGKKRGVLCDIEWSGRSLSLAAVHLSHRSEGLRVRSTRQLIELAAEKTTPLFVLGDLNATPPGFPASHRDADGKKTLAELDASGLFSRYPQAVPTAADLTYHSRQPESVIDWILIPNDWHFVNYAADPSGLSDHRPVVANVEPLHPLE